MARDLLSWSAPEQESTGRDLLSWSSEPESDLGFVGGRVADVKRGFSRARQSVDIKTVLDAKKYLTTFDTIDQTGAVSDNDLLALPSQTGVDIDFPLARQYANANPEQKQQLRTTYEDMLAQNVADFAARAEEQKTIPMTEARRQFDESGSFGEALKVFAQHPLEITSSLATESIIQFSPALPTAIGGPGGLAMGGGAVSFVNEYAGDITSSMVEAGIDITSPDAIKEALSNPETMKTWQDHATKRGLPIALIDAFSAGIAGRFVDVATTPLKKVGAGAAESLVMQPVLGGAGEVAGAVAAGDEVQGQAVLAEMIGEVGPGVVETAVGVRQAAKAVEQDKQSLESILDAQSIDEVIQAAEGAIEEIDIGTTPVPGAPIEEIDLARAPLPDETITPIDLGQTPLPGAPIEEIPITDVPTEAIDLGRAPLPGEPVEEITLGLPQEQRALPPPDQAGGAIPVAPTGPEQITTPRTRVEGLEGSLPYEPREYSARPDIKRSLLTILGENVTPEQAAQMVEANRLANEIKEMRYKTPEGVDVEAYGSEAKGPIAEFRKNPDSNYDDIVTTLAGAGGINIADAKAQGLMDVNERRGKHWVFTKKGMTLDQAGEYLMERGWFADRPDTNTVLSMVQDTLTGAKSHYSPSGQEYQTFLDERERAIGSQEMTKPMYPLERYEPDTTQDEAVLTDLAVDAIRSGVSPNVINKLGDIYADSPAEFATAIRQEKQFAIERGTWVRAGQDNLAQRTESAQGEAIPGIAIPGIDTPDVRTEAQRQTELKSFLGNDLYAELYPPSGRNLLAQATKVDKTEAAIDVAAQEAATSPQNDLPEPTEAQISAGNYKKGHLNIQGLEISVENPQGSTRSGTDETGETWSQELQNHYGYIRRTEGADGEQVDVFVGDNPQSDKVFVVDQINKDGSFDEHKSLIGFDDIDQATEAYKSNYGTGHPVGPVTEMTMGQFKSWLKNGDNTLAVDPEAVRGMRNLDTIQLTDEFQDEAGNKVGVSMTAKQALADIDSRIDAAKALLNCVRGG